MSRTAPQFRSDRSDRGITRAPALQTQLAKIVLAALLAVTPRAGHAAAPAKVGSDRIPAANPVELFEHGAVLEHEGDKVAAAAHYRAAAEANWALHEAKDPASAAYATFVARTIKGYDAAFNLSLSDDPELERSAHDWCTKILAKKTDTATSEKIRAKCVQWGWQSPSPPDQPPVPVEPPGGDLGTTEDDSQHRSTDEIKIGTGAIPPDETVPPPPLSPPPPPKLWKKLAFAGGYTLAGGTVFLALALAGAVRQHSIMRQEADTCLEPYNEGCKQLRSTGKALRPLTAASVIAGTLLTGTGAALLAIAMRQRAAKKVTLAPTLHPQFVGLALRGRF